MGVKEIIDGIRGARESAIECLCHGEFGYAERELRPLYVYMQPEFRRQVVDHFNVCNYGRVYDLLEHLWKMVEVPASDEEEEAAKRARDEKSAAGDAG